MNQQKVNIVGAGLAGLSAAITLAREHVPCRLISLQPSERAQSVLAEGGINGALNTMGEDDCPENHFQDTMKAGVYLADPEAVRGLAEHAPEILLELKKLGVPFNLQEEKIQQRNFGGQKKKRTAYARSSTGKVLMTALIDEARKYEAAGLITRYSHHSLELLQICERSRMGAEQESDRKLCVGVQVQDVFTGAWQALEGPVILATGGMNGIFPQVTTGTVANSGDAAALAFVQGVTFSNLEMIQYHPTTIQIAGKRCLVSEAARGEGGRLFCMRNEKPWYFMEEKYPELGNLMPRDVVSREMYFVTHQDGNMQHQDLTGNQVYLDMRHLSKETWEKKLPDLRSELKHYLGKDPAKEPIPVEPGIHYFMGGIDVDQRHRTNIDFLYAAGECCSQYHGANRLGGNSTMGAIYGGMLAAGDLAKRMQNGEWTVLQKPGLDNLPASNEDPRKILEVRDILLEALGIVRSEEKITKALEQIQWRIDQAWDGNGSATPAESDMNTLETCLPVKDLRRLFLAKAMLLSALIRKESRGAHYRMDYPETEAGYGRRTLSRITPDGQNVSVDFSNHA